MSAKDCSVVHQGDNRTGLGDGDDEQILIDLSLVAAEVSRIVIAVSIDQADARGQNFGQVRDAYCRVVNQDTDEEIVRFDLSEDAASETAMIFSELYRHNGEWKFRAVGQGYASGLRNCNGLRYFLGVIRRSELINALNFPDAGWPQGANNYEGFLMAGLTLTKGSNLSLTKTDPGLREAIIGLGWDPRTTTGDAFDLDASALLLGADGKVRSSADFIFYNQPSSRWIGNPPGRQPTGDGGGDDEQIGIDLSSVAADVERVVFVVSIDQAEERRQNFGQVRGAYCRVVNAGFGSGACPLRLERGRSP